MPSVMSSQSSPCRGNSPAGEELHLCRRCSAVPFVGLTLMMASLPPGVPSTSFNKGQTVRAVFAHRVVVRVRHRRKVCHREIHRGDEAVVVAVVHAERERVSAEKFAFGV